MKAIVWQKINTSLIQSDCGNYRVKKLDRGQVLYAAEVKVSEICWSVTWLRHTATEAKQACQDDKDRS